MIKPFKDTNKKTVGGFQKTMMWYEMKSIPRLMHRLRNQVFDKAHMIEYSHKYKPTKEELDEVLRITRKLKLPKTFKNRALSITDKFKLIEIREILEFKHEKNIRSKKPFKNGIIYLYR